MTDSKQNPIRVLLIEDNLGDARLLEALLAESATPFQFECVERMEEALERLSAGGVELVLSDLSLPDSRGVETFEKLHAQAPDIPIIVLSGLADEAIALEIVEKGAQDYLVKGTFDAHLLVRAMRYALKRAEADRALGDERNLLRSVIDNQPDAVYVKDTAGRYLLDNVAHMRSLGAESIEEVVGKTVHDFFPPEIAGAFHADDDLVIRTGRAIVNREERSRDQDGCERWLSTTKVPLRDREGRVTGMVGIGRDITERKHSEEQLLKLSRAVEQSANIVVITDREGRVEYANPKFSTVTGYALNEVLGTNPRLWKSGETPQEEYTQLWKTITAGGDWSGEFHNKKKNGELFWVTATISPVRNARGEITHFVAVEEDITERKRVEAQLARYNQELREKNQEMEDDLMMAREIQEAIIPQQFPAFPRGASPKESALHFFSRYLPTATVGGDFFHVLRLSDTKAGLFICDVMGHGVRAALVTAIQRALVEELAGVAADPAEFLTQINRALLAILRRTRTPMFASAFYLVADVESGAMQFASAGHPQPLHLHRDTGLVESLGGDTKPGPALGVFDDSVYATHATVLHPRDLVMLFTDGLFEVEDAQGNLYDQKQLIEAVRQRVQSPAPRLFDELLSEIQSFSGDKSFIDDVCLVAMEVVRTGLRAKE